VVNKKKSLSRRVLPSQLGTKKKTLRMNPPRVPGGFTRAKLKRGGRGEGESAEKNNAGGGETFRPLFSTDGTIPTWGSGGQPPSGGENPGKKTAIREGNAGGPNERKQTRGSIPQISKKKQGKGRGVFRASRGGGSQKKTENTNKKKKATTETLVGKRQSPWHDKPEKGSGEISSGAETVDPSGSAK